MCLVCSGSLAPVDWLTDWLVLLLPQPPRCLVWPLDPRSVAGLGIPTALSKGWWQCGDFCDECTHLKILIQGMCAMIAYEELSHGKVWNLLRRVDSSPSLHLSFSSESSAVLWFGAFEVWGPHPVFCPEVRLRLLNMPPCRLLPGEMTLGFKNALHGKKPLTFLHGRRRVSIKP